MSGAQLLFVSVQTAYSPAFACWCTCTGVMISSQDALDMMKRDAKRWLIVLRPLKNGPPSVALLTSCDTLWKSLHLKQDFEELLSVISLRRSEAGISS